MDEMATANLIAQVITVIGSLGFFLLTFQALKQLER